MHREIILWMAAEMDTSKTLLSRRTFSLPFSAPFPGFVSQWWDSSFFKTPTFGVEPEFLRTSAKMFRETVTLRVICDFLRSGEERLFCLYTDDGSFSQGLNI